MESLREGPGKKKRTASPGQRKGPREKREREDGLARQRDPLSELHEAPRISGGGRAPIVLKIPREKKRRGRIDGGVVFSRGVSKKEDRSSNRNSGVGGKNV